MISDDFEDETGDRLSPSSLKELEHNLSKLDDCDLGEWDRDFIDSLSKRVIRYGAKTVITGKQWAQLERIKEQYL